MVIKNIVFYYPSKITGGTEYLFIRYSRELANNHTNYNVIYIDYEDGFAKKELYNTNVHFITYTDGLRVLIPTNSVVIFQLNRISDFRSSANFDVLNTAFIFWCLHSKNLSSQVVCKSIPLLSRKDKSTIGQMIDNLSDSNVIKYLGYGAYIKIAKSFGARPHKVEEIPLVVPTEKYDHPINKQLDIQKGIRFCWLGRLDSEKTLNIITYMNELDIIYKSYPVSLSIIGYGDCEKKLRKESEKHPYPISFVGEKRDRELDDFLRFSVDIGLASGTSALEFGLRGIPVILQFVIHKVFKAGDASNFINLNEYILDYTETKRTKYLHEGKFLEKFNAIKVNYQKACNEAYDYSMSKSIPKGVEKLLSTIDHLSNTYDMNVYENICTISDLLLKALKRKEFLSKAIQLFKF